MNSVHPSTAIVLFARRAEDEAINKTLLASLKQNIRLHEGLIATSMAVAKSAGGTFLHFHEGLQRGDSFGDRIANCTESIFALGYHRIILIGGDCPELSRMDLDEATLALDSGRFALGADQRGGAYLIGFNREQYDFESFRELKWNTPKLFHEINDYAERFSEVSFLQRKFDLNRVEDVVEYNSVSGKLLEILQLIFKEIAQLVHAQICIVHKYNSFRINRRGPPKQG